MSDIDLIPVSGLSGMNFFIPSYQRGYRWTEQQVKDLLNDINEFDPKAQIASETASPNEEQKAESYYCLQPVVVREITNEKGKYGLGEGKWYEVIDGQQRLTTIFLILKFLKEQGIELKFKDKNGVEKKWEEYKLRYETRKGSETFLGEVGSQSGEETESVKEEEGNIDYYHIREAYKCIKSWFDEHGNIIDIFADKLLNETRFIWYKTEEDPVEVFTRINMWKIPLTNGELVKALFLNRMNFGKDEKIQSLKQQEIAMQWDEIEYALRDNNFWFFFNQEDEKKSTRIDAILDIMHNQEQERYEKGEIDESDLGVFRHIRDNSDVKGEDKEKVDNVLGKKNDKYRKFRYFYYYFNEMCDKSGKTNEIAENPIDDTEKKGWIGERGWKIIKEIFQTLKDWYDDIECYHYVSFLVSENGNNSDDKVISDLLRKWRGSDGKREFIDKKLKNDIRETIKNCKNLDTPYDQIHDCEPLLLLFNIQTVINQANNLKAKYGNKDFARFPFYIYKKENWDIEHIDSNTHNELTDRASQKEWLYYVYEESGDKREMIRKFLEDGDWSDFNELKKKLDVPEDDESSDDEKNKIKNFALLDSNTNRGYGNSIFSAKRRKIIDKDQGKKSRIEVENGKLKVKRDKLTGKTPFIPPCTKNVFLKYYSPTSTSADANSWTSEDKKYYLQNIYDTLSELFDVTSEEVEKKS